MTNQAMSIYCLIIQIIFHCQYFNKEKFQNIIFRFENNAITQDA